MRRFAVSLVLTALLPGTAWGQVEPSAEALGRARALIEQGRPEAALSLLEPVVERPGAPAEAYVLLAYCRLMLDDEAAAERALASALERDPTWIEAWQMHGALALDRERYDEAVAAFERLQGLEPEEAREYDLNIGAAHLLAGDLPSASRHFNRYLGANRTRSEAYFLVAKNYALGERWDLAVQHLEAAVRLDERTRRRARHDPNFEPMRQYEPFVRLLATDTYQRPADGWYRRLVFDETYDGGRGPLLTGVLNALQMAGTPFDPAVEVTDGWALVWSDIRIKIGDAIDGGGQVELSAPRGAFSERGWAARTADFRQAVEEQLALLALHSR